MEQSITSIRNEHSSIWVLKSQFMVSQKQLIGQFKRILECLLNAHLKTQQRLFFIRTYLNPSYQHTLALMKTTKTELLNFDRYHYIRKMLKMPKDLYKFILHSSIRRGGLAIPSLVIRLLS